MYCMKFRRSSLRIDANSRSNRQSELHKNQERRPQRKTRDHEDLHPSGCKTNSSLKNCRIIPLTSCQKDPKQQIENLDEEQKYKSNEHYTTTSAEISAGAPKGVISRDHQSITNDGKSKYEEEQRQQEIDKPTYIDLSTRSFPSDFRNGRCEGTRRYQNPELIEEKKDDDSDFLPSIPNGLEHSVWVNQNLPSGNRQDSLVSPTQIFQYKARGGNAPSKEMKLLRTSLSNQRLRNELNKSHQMLNMEKNVNLNLRHKLQNTERQLKAIEVSQSMKEDSRRIQKLEEEVAYYRKGFEIERKKRQEFEDELGKTRLENKNYVEQMDLLIFEYIPNVAPKFKDIGPVNYDSNESYNSVGSYQLGDIIGEGYYGSVRVGSHAKKEQRFAVKILKKSNISRFKDLKQISIEIHVLKTYQHHNIIQLEEIIHAPENIYMVTELCYMDLHKYHNETGLTIESARQVVFGILHPLQHLHRSGICHLDLKPENILLTKPLDSHNAKHNYVRICDFGLVSMERSSDENKDIIREGYVCGTPGFYAPEMILQDRFEGKCADMWSLGCIILEITLGFTQDWIDSYDQADNATNEFKRGLESCLNELSVQQYPDYVELLDMIHSCLSIDPLERISSKHGLMHSWLKNI